MLPNNPNTPTGHETRASAVRHDKERDYLRAQAKLAKEDFKRAAKGSVKSTRRLFNIPAWVERSPFGTLAAAFVVGYVAESCLGSRSRQHETNGDQAENRGEASTSGRSNHRFIAMLIERTVRQLIESSLIAWLIPAFLGRETESDEQPSPTSENAYETSDTTSSPIEA